VSLEQEVRENNKHGTDNPESPLIGPSGNRYKKIDANEMTRRDRKYKSQGTWLKKERNVRKLRTKKKMASRYTFRDNESVFKEYLILSCAARAMIISTRLFHQLVNESRRMLRCDLPESTITSFKIPHIANSGSPSTMRKQLGKTD
jgi:hypothetical protein